jgi:hypothetical protein
MMDTMITCLNPGIFVLIEALTIACSVQRLRSEVEVFIDRASDGFNDRKKKSMFCINNYDLIISLTEVLVKNLQN